MAGFTLYPAIDLKDGACVRLLQGRMEDATVYASDPGAMAKAFQEGGASYLHVVDLNGAFAGRSVNEPAIRAIREALAIPMELGGGVRTLEQAAYLLEEVGVDRVILGTAALEEPALVGRAVARFGADRVAVGIDAKDGRVAVRGWAQVSEVTARELALRLREEGARTLIYTDISRDGMLSGPNLEASRRLLEDTGMALIVSGGVSRLEDIQGARAIGAAGVIVGKALYSGAFTLAEALEAAQEGPAEVQ